MKRSNRKTLRLRHSASLRDATANASFAMTAIALFTPKIGDTPLAKIASLLYDK